MKTPAALLALLLAFPPPAPAAGIETSTVPATVISTEPFTGPVTVTAPRISEDEVLKTARAAGAGTAVAGGGLMAYSILFAAGPFGWAAALVFLGGMTSYLSHRRLQGKEDFKWGAAPPPPQAPATARP